MLRATSRTMRFTLSPESVLPYSAALIHGSAVRFFTSVRRGRYHRLHGTVLGERGDARRDRAGAKGGDHGERGVERREAWDARFYGSAADEKAVSVDGLSERGCVDDRGALARPDQLQDVLTSLRELANLRDVDAERADEGGRSGRRDQVVAEPMEPLDDRDDLR